jgi:V/A-type H+-transporting ATPase subunit A
VSALPGSERVVLLAGRLLREGVLQQSALSSNDAFCSAAKGAGLVDAVLDVVGRCEELVGRGVPAAAVEETDFGPLLRAAGETGPEDVDGVQERAAQMLAVLADLDGPAPAGEAS